MLTACTTTRNKMLTTCAAFEISGRPPIVLVGFVTAIVVTVTLPAPVDAATVVTFKLKVLAASVVLRSCDQHTCDVDDSLRHRT